MSLELAASVPNVRCHARRHCPIGNAPERARCVGLQLADLAAAQAQEDPVLPSFWRRVAALVPGKTPEQCIDQAWPPPPLPPHIRNNACAGGVLVGFAMRSVNSCVCVALLEQLAIALSACHALSAFPGFHLCTWLGAGLPAAEGAPAQDSRGGRRAAASPGSCGWKRCSPRPLAQSVTDGATFRRSACCAAGSQERFSGQPADAGGVAPPAAARKYSREVRIQDRLHHCRNHPSDETGAQTGLRVFASDTSGDFLCCWCESCNFTASELQMQPQAMPPGHTMFCRKPASSNTQLCIQPS